MYSREFAGINSFLVGMAQLLLAEGVERETRGKKCYELTGPVMIKITNPTARLVTLPERRWNETLPYVESLWLASGRNDIKMLTHYVKRMIDFSDDNQTMRAGYGPRLRFFNGIANDYDTGHNYEHQAHPQGVQTIEIDQFEFVERSFQKDPFTRQAIITIGDPSKDCFKEEHVLKSTKDFPCTRDLQFIRTNNKLDLIVHMRSNDFVWGASAVNIFNFTFIQEYFAHILGLEIGNYYHIANNFHYYEDQKEKVESLAASSLVEDVPYLYKKSFKTLADFDKMLLAFQNWEDKLREDNETTLIDFEDDFFNDWAKVLYHFKSERTEDIDFANPVLQKIIRNKKPRTSVLLQDVRDQFKDTFVINAEDGKHTYWRQYI